MNVRIDLLAYWLIALHSAVASAQNFDRLLPPRNEPTARMPAYRSGIDDARQAQRSLRPDFDYQSLRDDVYRNFRSEFSDTVRPVRATRDLPPPRFENGAAERYRLPADTSPSLLDRSPERARWEARYRQLQMERERDYQGTDRFRPTGSPDYDCPGGDCWKHRENVRPIHHEFRGADFIDHRSCDRGRSDDRYWGLDRERFDVSPAAYQSSYRRPPLPDDYRASRMVIDKDGSYVRENLYGDPRVFNPDQPVRNLFRFMFP
jgi:hypothetical protein